MAVGLPVGSGGRFDPGNKLDQSQDLVPDILKMIRIEEGVPG